MAISPHCKVSSLFLLPVFITILFFLVSGGLADPPRPEAPTDDGEAGVQHLHVVNVINNHQGLVARPRVKTEGTVPTLEITFAKQSVEQMIEEGLGALPKDKVFPPPNRPQQTRPAEEPRDRSEL